MVNIFLADSTEDLNEICKLRSKLILNEGFKKLASVAQHPEAFRDELDQLEAFHFCVEEFGILHGTARLNIDIPLKLSEKNQQAYQWHLFKPFFHHKFALLSYFAIDHQTDPNTLQMLIQSIYQLAREEKALLLFTSCNPPMLQLYEQLGFRRYTRNFNDPYLGYMVPLVMILDENEFLKRIHSPLYELSLEFPNQPTTLEWFENSLLKHRPSTIVKNIDSKDFWNLFHTKMIQKGSVWKLISEKLSKKPLESISLLKGLSEEDAQKVVELGKLLTFQKGDKIIHREEIGREMFVIISGRVAVTRSLPDKEHTIAVLDTGEIFGEMAFVSQTIRTSNVLALEDVEVLALSQDYLNRLMSIAPEIAARILMNLSVVLVERLRSTTNKWVQVIG